MFRGSGDRIEPERNPLVRLVRRFVPMVDGYVGQKFIVRGIRGWMATPLLLVLLVVEWSDLVFAIDSIPAIFAVTRDPFIVYSSNVFAILGLRALFFVLAGMMDRFEYLKPGVAAILVFVGFKMLFNGLFHMPTVVSLAVIVGILGGSVVLSMRKTQAGRAGRRVVASLFAGTTVLITGASRGIGAAFAARAGRKRRPAGPRGPGRRAPGGGGGERPCRRGGGGDGAARPHRRGRGGRPC